MSLDDSQAAAFSALQAGLDTARDAPSFARRVIAAVASLCCADGAVLWLRDPQEPDFAVAHRGGPRLSEVSRDLLVAEDRLLTQALIHGRGVITRYASSSLRDPAIAREGVRSIAFAPIEVSGRRLGALAALRIDGPPLDEGELRLLSVAAGQIGTLLAAQAARDDHARAVARERLLARTVADTAEAASLDEALQRLLAGAVTIARSPLCVLLTPAGDATSAAASAGPQRELLGHGELLGPLPENVVAQLAHGRPLVAADGPRLLARLRPKSRGLRRRAAHLGIRYAIVVPLVLDRDVVGVLLVAGTGDAPDPALLGPLQTLAAHASGVLRRSHLLGELERAYLDTVGALANALEARDAVTHEHARAIATLSLAVGRRLGLQAADLRDVEFGAILHDIGKIAIPDGILTKRGPLSGEEWSFMRKHTRIGERILRGIPFLAGAAAAVRSAHERWDGDGYPDGLSGEDIPVAARIIFACDTWDVMTSDRPYRSRLERAEAIERLRAAAGSQLDPHVVDTLCEVLGEPVAETRHASPANA